MFSKSNENIWIRWVICTLFHSTIDVNISKKNSRFQKFGSLEKCDLHINAKLLVCRISRLNCVTGSQFSRCTVFCHNSLYSLRHLRLDNSLLFCIMARNERRSVDRDLPRTGQPNVCFSWSHWNWIKVFFPVG